MKKTYIIPQTKSYAVSTQTVLIGTSETSINESNRGDFVFSKGERDDSDFDDEW